MKAEPILTNGDITRAATLLLDTVTAPLMAKESWERTRQKRALGEQKNLL